MKFSTRNFIVIILCMCFILSFAACNDKDNPVDPVTTEQPAVTTPEPDVSPEPTVDPASIPEIEIVESVSNVYHSSTKGARAVSYIICENKSDKFAYIGSVTFDLEASDGSIVDTIPFLTAFPNSVKPGERFVVYVDDQLSIDTNDETLKIYPTFTVEELTSEYQRLEIVEADEKVSLNEEHNTITCKVKIKNQHPSMIPLYFVCATLYDKEDHVIGQFNQVFTDCIANGVEKTVVFEDNLGMFNNDPELVARIEYVAAPYAQVQGN